MVAKEESTEVIVENNPKGVAETSIASTIIPYDFDDEKALFLGYRACGLSVRETLNMIKRSKAWLSGCRLDPKFKELEGKIPEFQKELGKDYIRLEFFRNFRLVLEKDHRILKKSLSGEILTKNEHDYLIKMRSQYSPAQIQILESVAGKADGGFDFAKFVAENPDLIMASRTDTVVVKK